jgi:FAD/FMN-containing dehydrogenase
MTIESSAPAGATPAAAPEPSGRAHLLRGLCAGAVLLPGDPGYDEARMPWNVAVDQRPAAVAYPATADEVGEIVRAAAASGLKVAPQGTGHNAGPLGPLDDVVLLRTSGMTAVTIDPERRIARAEAGALWQDVVEAAAPYGLAAAAATSASSPRSSSGSSRSRRPTPGCCSGTRSTPRRCCAPGPRGPRPRLTA